MDSKTQDGDTIFAASSGAGKAGVCVIRLSGPHSSRVVRALCGAVPKPRRASLRTLTHPESSEELDRALVLWLPGPQSFTGEDMAELHVHGGAAVVAGVLSCLGAQSGLRPADAGEFTRRAFDAGRLDLTQVEGLADLIEAQTQAQRRQALRQVSGSVGERYEAWRSELIGCLAYFEADIDFPEEDGVPASVLEGIAERLRKLVGEFEFELDGAHRGERLRDGLRVVIAGAPNVGKSSLLNALARRDAAIVSQHAGTTRDVIEVHLDLKGYPVILCDTAGLRAAGDDVEREGVARTRARLEDADIVLWVRDASQGDCCDESPEPLSACKLHVTNKVDLVPEPGGMEVPSDVLGVSARTGAGLGTLQERLSDRVVELFSELESPAVTRARHRTALEACRAAVLSAIAAMDEGSELAAEDLRHGARQLARVTGRIDVEDLLDVIFSDFCIGK